MNVYPATGYGSEAVISQVFVEGTAIFSSHQFDTGDWVIYRKQKSSTSPGPRAENVHAAQKGNLYRYTVDKFWIVEKLEPDGQLLLRTRRGKRHSVASDDPALRKARVWERWIYRSRFEGSDLMSGETGDPGEPDLAPVATEEPAVADSLKDESTQS